MKKALIIWLINSFIYFWFLFILLMKTEYPYGILFLIGMAVVLGLASTALLVFHDNAVEKQKKKVTRDLAKAITQNKIEYSGDQLPNIKFGLYEIFWNDGGSSLASVGQMYDGELWIAPCNWTSKDNPTGLLSKHMDSIEKMVLIKE